MKRVFLPLVVATVVLSAATLRAQAPAASSSSSSASAPATDTIKDIRVVLHTDKGDVEATLFATKAPLTTANFLNLAQQKFYDGLKFHRVVEDFMIQGGDPLGNGLGGPGYQFEDEANKDSKTGKNLKFDKPGVFAMANRGTNTNGSQFFITHVPVPRLDDGAGSGHYTIFGQVTKGQSVVNNIQQGDKIKAIDILDSTSPLFNAQSKQIEEWNSGLKLRKKQE